MRPGAADLVSPIASPLSKPSAHPQNPKPPSDEPPSSNPFHFSSLGSDVLNLPSRSARSRPRLAKQRRHHARSRAGPAELGPELNPFLSVSGAGTGSSDSNQFGFVFGAKLSGVDERTEVSEAESVSADPAPSFSCGERRDCNTDANLSSENGDFTECVGDLGCSLNVGHAEYCGNEAEGRSNHGVDFVFGSGLVNESRGNVEKLVNEVGREMRVGSESGFEKVFEFRSEESRSSDKVHEGSFVFGSGGQDCKLPNCQGEVKASDEDLGDRVSNLHSGTDNLSSDFSSKCNVVFEMSDETCADDHKRTDHVGVGSEGKTVGDTNGGFSSSTQFTFQAGLGDNVDAGEPDCKINEPIGVSGPCSFSSTGPGVQINGCGSEAASAGGVKCVEGSGFTSSPNGFGVFFEDFDTPLRFSSCLKENLFPEINKSNISVKGKSVRDKRSRKTKGKLKKPLLSKQWPAQDNVPTESSSQETPVSAGCGSPMDFSPYETTVVDPYSRESSTMSNDSFHLDRNTAPSVSEATAPNGPNGDEGVFAAKGGHIFGKAIDENAGYLGERISAYNGSAKWSASGAETPCFSSKNEHVNGITRAGKDSEDVKADMGLNLESQEWYCGSPCFASGFENMERKPFTFVASSSAEGSPAVARRQLCRVKYKKKVGCNTFVISPSPNVEFGKSDESAPSTPLRFNVVGKSEPHEQVQKAPIPSADATHETCEKWRIRGNKAYRNKDFSKAEDCYTQGIVSVPSSNRLGSCLKPLLLCYSNRAATRMYLGKIREGLGDCMMAAALDPNFLKVQMRAANFHLLLGEVENAQRYFNNCLESGPGVCLDRRIVIDSADGIQKAQKVAEYMNRSSKLLEQRTADAALSALEIISEALSISEHSEKLLEMKAEALCLLRRYEEAIQLCEQSMHFAEKNFSSLNSVVNMDSSGSEDHPYARLWRWFFISKSYFHLGKFEAALHLLEKLEQVGSIKDRYANLECSISLAATIRELLNHKDAGNGAFKSGRHTEAVEHYTVAVSRSVGSRPFSAICLCNRAAAHQALGQIADAIADCSLAMALDRNYAKAVSRRATLHEMIRDYGQAASDLQTLISVLENQSGDKAKEPTLIGSSNDHAQELRNAYRRMPLMEEEAKKGIPLNFYLILGIKPSDSSSDIKKAYRKAALKHHPDKAGQFLARSESGDEGRVWKEISLEVHNDADRLFKVIGEAYAVLSDPDKRSEYDLEEDIRKSAKEGKDRGIYRKSSDVQSPRCSSYGKSDFYSSPFERSSYCRSRRESWKTYGDSYSRW